MKFTKFVPLSKMEEQPDGTLFVYGTVTAEQPDLSNEVCDYEGTKPYYKSKVAAMFKLTSSVDGMTPSLMPMREMHQLKSIGAGRTIEFDDAAKTIRMGFEVVDPVAVQKFKKGVLIGFSQGGDYIGELIDDPVFKGCKRYVADPAEVSGVDAPCLPSALVDAMKGRTVALAKANGVTEQIALQTPAPATHLDLSKPGVVKHALSYADRDPEERKALIVAAKSHAIDVPERDQRAIQRLVAKAIAAKGLGKGLYEVGWLGDMIEQLHWLCLQTEFERDMEDDGSKVPEGLRGAWMSLLAEFKAMAVEEADELAADGGKGEKAMKITTQADLTKAAKTMHDHLEGLAEKHMAFGEKMEKGHESNMKAHEAMGGHIEKCMKAAMDASEGEMPESAMKAATATDLTKFAALEGQIADLVKSQKELTEKMSKTAAPGNTPHTGAAAELAKAAPAVPAGFEDLIQAPAVTH